MISAKHYRLLTRLAYFALAMLAGWITLNYLLPWLLPFLIALLVARLIEPAVTFLNKKFRLPRAVSSAVCVLVSFLLLFTALWLIVWRAISELNILASKLPEFLNRVPQIAESLRAGAERLISALPGDLQEFLTNSLNKALENGIVIPNEFYAWVMGILSAAASSFPSITMFVIAAVLSTYFISRDYRAVTSFIIRQFPETLREKILKTQKHMLVTVGHWLRAQGILISMTFAQLFLCFLLIRLEYALLLAALVAFLDALPMIGAGLVLLPWGVVCLLSGDFSTGVILLTTLVSVSVVRAVSEPHLVGEHLGLPSLAALISMYIGFRLVGLWGVFVFPILAITVKQLHDWKYIRLWKE
ncbi:sporulation integral membrane protein YtvI [Clostridia bacterium]|nr:sporulation integral membrane protein YtvI [Clostridia bacterium]